MNCTEMHCTELQNAALHFTSSYCLALQHALYFVYCTSEYEKCSANYIKKSLNLDVYQICLKPASDFHNFNSKCFKIAAIRRNMTIFELFNVLIKFLHLNVPLNELTDKKKITRST